MISHLANKHSVFVASLAHTAAELEEGTGLENYCEELIVEVLPNHVRWLNALKAMPTSASSSVAYFWSRRLHHRIRKRVRHIRFDVVMVHCAFVTQYVEKDDRGFRILDYGDIDSAKWSDYARQRPVPLSLGYAMEARKLRKYEHSKAELFHQLVVTTHGEKEEFEKLRTGRGCAVIPNGVDTSYFKPMGSIPGPVVAFLGRMDYFPNIDGVCYFAEEVFPFIRQQIPDAKFVIIGSNPSRRVRSLERFPGISVTGHVPDVRVRLKEAAVSIAPLRIARGTQNKILESMAMGIPVVATPNAVKGIQATPGRHLLVGHQPMIFAEHVIQLLKNDDLRRDLSSAATHLARTYTWRNSMMVLDDLLDRHSVEEDANTFLAHRR